MSKLLDYLITLPQYIFPQHALTAIVYRLTRIRVLWFKNTLIQIFIRVFNVNMEEAEKANASDYVSFNDFFTRYLKTDARTWHIDKKKLLSPVDGAVSQIGAIQEQTIIQAKGKDYSLEQLLASDQNLIDTFKSGEFATLYLSPRDYHRIHMPLSGQLQQSIFVPGRLFAVNNPTARTVDSLFAVNERYIAIFDTAFGKMAMIMVGALFVGSMETVWEGQITPHRDRQLEVKHYQQNPISLQQGDEFGLFNMGSTVILLFENNRMNWDTQFSANTKIQVGNVLGNAMPAQKL